MAYDNSQEMVLLLDIDGVEVNIYNLQEMELLLGTDDVEA